MGSWQLDVDSLAGFNLEVLCARILKQAGDPISSVCQFLVHELATSWILERECHNVYANHKYNKIKEQELRHRCEEVG